MAKLKTDLNMVFDIRVLKALVFPCLVSFLALLITSSCTKAKQRSDEAPPFHLELDMSGAEYAQLLKSKPTLLNESNESDELIDGDEKALKPVLDLGKRNMDLLSYINKHRDPAHVISLTSKATQAGIPVDQPREYNVAIVLNSYNDLVGKMPTELKNILLNGGAFPENPPIDEEEYKAWGLKTDVVYQIGMRWLLMKPYLGHYAKRLKEDVRGFYNLSRDPNLAKDLASWSTLDSVRQTTLRNWLIGSCYNAEDLSTCKRELASAEKSVADLKSFASRVMTLSKKHWDHYFVMQWDRSDIDWSSKKPEVFRIPFVDPKDSDVVDYLRTNIEEEWQWKNWNLRLEFQAGSELTMTHLRYEAGVTPHVEVPNTIVMDKNQPRTEYDSRWTIRHEFGHILGFADCYIEFYDQAQEKMISYQLDITNLMCSRRGEFKQTHFDELKRVYFKN